MTVPTPTPTAWPAAAPAEQLEFHRLARARARYRWWLTPLTGLLGLAFYLVLLLAVIVPVGILSAFDERLFALVQELSLMPEFFDLDRPWLFTVLMLPLILMIPVLLAASRIVQGRGVGLLWSVAGRIRWRWLGRTLALALAVYAACWLVTLVIAVLSGEQLALRLDHPGLGTMVLLVLLLVPLQSAAEEYVFRGYLMQLVGGWLRHPAFAILLPAPLFVIGHVYDVWGMASVAAVAVAAGWISWRTGGLEAAIALHVVNNVSIFLLGSVGLVDANASTGTPVDLAVSIVTIVVFVVLADRSARARGISRTLERATRAPSVAPAVA